MKKIIIGFGAFAILLFISLSCVNSTSKNNKASLDSEKQYYLDLGKNISSSTQGVLGKNLMGALAKGGPEYALEFCNAEAIPLTDSMAVLLKATIKRVSDKPRNQKNEANAFEKAVMVSQKEQLKNGDLPKPTIKEIKGKMVGYYPIVTNGMCLQCHGKVNQMVQQKTFNKISSYYPNDKALGYDVNQLRGLWVVEMQKTK